MDYYGLPVRSLDNGYLRVDYLAQDGPRLVRAVLAGSQANQLAETPEVSWETPYGPFHLWGGHRLWHAPEAAPRSSIPDDGDLHVAELPGGVCLSRPPEQGTGIVKAIEIRLHPDRAQLTLLHTLENCGLRELELAPWAITQVPLGGVALLPQPAQVQEGLHPDRHVVLWPYASWTDPRLRLQDDFLFVQGQPRLPPFKAGILNTLGWLAYAGSEVLFVKRFDPQSGRPFPDLGCNAEIYVNDRFLELETLGPLRQLAPGQSVTHTETWEFYPRAEASAILGVKALDV